MEVKHVCCKVAGGNVQCVSYNNVTAGMHCPAKEKFCLAGKVLDLVRLQPAIA